MYADDRDETLPHYQRPFGGTWYYDPQLYMENWNITFCPSKPEWNESDPIRKVGYGLNEVVFPAEPPAGSHFPRPVGPAQINYPAETIGGAVREQDNVRCVGPGSDASTTWPYNVARATTTAPTSSSSTATPSGWALTASGRRATTWGT